MTRFSDAFTTALCQEMSPSLERKRRVSSPALVKMLGADARLSSNDDEPEWDRGPLPEVSDSDWAEFDALRNVNKGEAWHQRNDAAAVEAQLVEFRARGLL